MPCHALKDFDRASPLLLTWTPDNKLVNKDASSAAPLDVTLQSTFSHNGVDSAPSPDPAARAAASVRLQVLRPCIQYQPRRAQLPCGETSTRFPIAGDDGAWCSQHLASVVARCIAVRMTSCMLTRCHKCALQVAAETDDRSQKTSKRRLWSDDLDLSPEQQARGLDAYLAIDPWADEVKPADYQVRAFSMRTAWKPPGYSSRLNTLSRQAHWVLLVV